MSGLVYGWRVAGQRALLAIASLVLLAGCGGMRVVGKVDALGDLPHYTVTGRFAAREGERSVAGRLSWQHEPGGDVILLQDPFGRGLAELQRSPAGARLRLADGRELVAADGQALVAELSGVAVPVDAIGLWLTGRNGAHAEVERDARGRIVHLNRDGWRVDYSYDAGDDLPERIFASRAGGPEVRLSVDSWEIPQ